MTAPIDYHLENLGTYLKTELNAAGAALSSPITVVEDVSYLGDFNAADKFPLLLIYRTGGRGYGSERQEFWEIIYLLSNYGDVYEVPRILAWLFEKHNPQNIPTLLEQYFAASDRCNQLDLGSLEWAYLYRNANAGARIRFTLEP